MEKENQLQREARAETRGTHVTKQNNNQKIKIIIIVMDNTPHLHQNNYHTKDTKTAQHKIK